MKKRIEHIRKIAEILDGYYEHKPRKAAFVVLAEDDGDLRLSRLFCGDKETLIEGVCENLSEALVTGETDIEKMRGKMNAFIRGLRKATYEKWEQKTGEKVPCAVLD